MGPVHFGAHVREKRARSRDNIADVSISLAFCCIVPAEGQAKAITISTLLNGKAHCTVSYPSCKAEFVLPWAVLAITVMSREHQTLKTCVQLDNRAGW